MASGRPSKGGRPLDLDLEDLNLAASVNGRQEAIVRNTSAVIFVSIREAWTLQSRTKTKSSSRLGSPLFGPSGGHARFVHSHSGLDGEREARYTLEVPAVAGQEDAPVANHDPCDETVCHADGSPLLLEVPSHLRCPISGFAVQRHDRQRCQQGVYEGLLRSAAGTGFQLEARHRRRRDPAPFQLKCDAARHWLMAAQKVDEHIGVGDDREPALP